MRVEPELRSQMVAVLEGKAPLEKVFAFNQKARAAGLETGMTRLQAEAWPNLALRARSHCQETAAHAALFDCARSFSPRVEETAADTFILDIAGTESLLGSPVKLAGELAQCAANVGLQTNVAVASNPDAATIAARGCSGVTILAREDQEERLGSLPLQALFPPHVKPSEREEVQQFLETLERWGIRNLRAFAALPEIAISERLGQKGLHWQKLARGAHSRTLVPTDRPPLFEEAVELEHPLVLLEPLAFLLNRLLEQLCARLRARSLAAQELRLKLGLDPCMQADSASDVLPQHLGCFSRTLRLPVPMLDARIFLKLLQLDLRAHPPGAPITKIWLAAQPTRMRPGQAGLFVPPSPEPEKLELTLARISGIVGETNVGAVELLDTHRPEGFRMRHFMPMEQEKNRRAGRTPELGSKKPSTGIGKRETTAEVRHKEATSGAKREESSACMRQQTGNYRAPEEPNDLVQRCNASVRGHSQLARQKRPEQVLTALRVFRPPQPARVTVRDGVPARIACSTEKVSDGEILWQAGPWRSSGDWWEQEPWARDEWDIAIPSAAGLVLYRLVHDLVNGRWWVEGTYD
ncbi:MAG: DNA polymerase Y family protein [Acidobacteria bacterium]|nr:DNA polymerase Y family protein [Acidobacteriota bacterium]